MNALPILIDDRLMTAKYWMPVRRNWAEFTHEIVITRTFSPHLVRERRSLAIVDSVLARPLLDTHLIITNHAIVSRQISMLNMVTNQRPDVIESVTAMTPRVSLAGRALAEVIINRFYGIEIKDWVEDEFPVDDEHIKITEGVDALIQEPDDQHYHEDLGRAWFLMTNTPFVSHVCLVPHDTVDQSPDAVREAVADLDRLLDASVERARELRRNLSKDFNIDRELMTEVLSGQTNQLGDDEVSGLSSLFSYAGLIKSPSFLRERMIMVDA